jgi:hypothetical protein
VTQSVGCQILKNLRKSARSAGAKRGNEFEFHAKTRNLQVELIYISAYTQLSSQLLMKEERIVSNT